MGTNVGRASARPLRRECRAHLIQKLRRVDVHRLGDANQFDDVEPPRAALDLRQIRRRKAELRRDIHLLELRPLARANEYLAEDAQLVRQFGLGGDAVGAAVARGHGVAIEYRVCAPHSSSSSQPLSIPSPKNIRSPRNTARRSSRTTTSGWRTRMISPCRPG